MLRITDYIFSKIQASFHYSNYQTAQLRHAFIVYGAELSKALIIALFFLDRLPLYIWTLLVFMIIRQATGGMHFKTYISCLLASGAFFVLSIQLLPLIPITRTIQLIFLFACILICHGIGPVVSNIHPPLSQEAVSRAKLRLITTILGYMALLFILPESIYMCAGFWIIVLNTLQLIVAGIRKEVSHSHEN